MGQLTDNGHEEIVESFKKTSIRILSNRNFWIKTVAIQ